jgi:hypothetical protein
MAIGRPTCLTLTSYFLRCAVTDNWTDYRETFAKRADYQKAHPSHRTRTLLGREESNFASGYADYLRGQYAARELPPVIGADPLTEQLEGGRDVTKQPNLAWVPVSEAIRRLGVGKQRIHQLLVAGLLDGQQFGSLWLVSAKSIEARLTEHPKGGGRRRWQRYQQSRNRS